MTAPLTIHVSETGTSSNYVPPEIMAKLLPVLETYVQEQKKLLELEKPLAPIVDDWVAEQDTNA